MAEGTGAAGADGQGGVEDSTQVGEVQGMLADYLPVAKDEGGEKKPEEKSEVVEEVVEAKAEPEPEKESTKAEPSADVKALIAQVTALQAKIDAMGKPQEAEKPKEEAKPLLSKYFSKQEDFEAAFEKPEALEAVLNKVRADAVEDMTKNLPQVVTNLVKTHLTVTKAVDSFYAKNPDLDNKREFVSHVANELMGKNPGWSLSKLFNEELGKEVNKRLGTKPGAAKPGVGQPPPPRGQRKPADKAPSLDGLQKEIVDLVM